MTGTAAAVKVRTGAYHDSVTLMQVSRRIQDLPGVTTAVVAMATGLNLELLGQLGFAVPDATSPNDLFIAVAAVDQDALEAALADVDDALTARPTSGTASGAVAARSVGSAARQAGDASTLVLVSTPGRVAALDAADGLDAGLDVMLFSDNVSLGQEVALKDLAVRRRRLLMGPDCGTAVVDGVALGFANVVRPGPVGIVAASGTGAQHLMSLLADVEIGVRHCLGVGGRDMSAAVGGRSTKIALHRLDDDDSVDLVVVISKPADPTVAAELELLAAALRTPVVFAPLGPGRADLTDTAREVAGRLGVSWTPPPTWGTARRPIGPGFLRGLYSGGTLCDESMLISVDRLGRVASNIPLHGQPSLDKALTGTGHTFVDFGDDELTVGRPHPMIDQSLRIERLVRELADPECAVVLLDVVLGHGAHPNPASELAPVIAASDVPVVVALVGTRDDPQNRDRQAGTLADAGALVHASNADATRAALALVDGHTP